MAALVGRSPRRRAATLPGHRVGRLAGRPWAGIAPAPAESATGTLYDDLTPAELCRLDRYEGADYRRVAVRIRTTTGGYRSWVYLPRRPVEAVIGAPPSEPVDRSGWRALGLTPPPRRRPSASRHRPC
jgi:gamma-glutamylcyclotransferase (GGCT)/AIG2-like uncharacterized protein YtfP